MSDGLAGRIEELEVKTDELLKQFSDLTSEVQPFVDDDGDNQVQAKFGLYTALVVDTVDVYKQNRVRFYNPLLHEPAVAIRSLPYAYPISSLGGFDDCGASWVPPAGSTIVLGFEGGNPDSPFYIGTTWIRDRGPDGANYFTCPVPEYDEIYKDRRNGYLCGPNDGSQVLPPWNTESYNGYDITSITDITNDSDLLRGTTYPNIFGFKTPEKHMIKMVDGDPRCNRKWKRLEIMSGCGNWLIMKDDHLHYCGQWAHPACGTRYDANNPVKGDTSCTVGFANPAPQSVFDPETGQLTNDDPEQWIIGEDTVDLNTVAANDFLGGQEDFTLGEKSELVDCRKSDKKKSNATIIGGAPDYQGVDVKNQQQGANPFFKQLSECRPYRGPQTPQNNKCDLPQTGIQLLSISGHTFVMDDSVKDPQGNMEWPRSTKAFDFGCSDKYVGRTYWKSATGHTIEMNDKEKLDSSEKVRDQINGIKLKSAVGNTIFLCDESNESKCEEGTESRASKNQGIKLTSTSNHQIFMCDENNLRKINCRRETNSGPEAKAGGNAEYGQGARIEIRTGYGLMFEMNDGITQEESNGQKIRLLCPQNGNTKRGPSYFEMAEDTDTTNGRVSLRCGGDYTFQTFGDVTEFIGFEDELESKGNKISFVKGKSLEQVGDYKQLVSKTALLYSKNVSYLLAGQDYDPKLSDAEQKLQEEGIEIPFKEKGPNICSVLVFDGARGKVVLSDRLYASASKEAKPAVLQYFEPLQPQDIPKRENIV